MIILRQLKGYVDKTNGVNANDGDVIVLAGKGHEDYQEIKGVKYPMDERVLIDEIINEDEVKKIL